MFHWMSVKAAFVRYPLSFFRCCRYFHGSLLIEFMLTLLSKCENCHFPANNTNLISTKTKLENGDPLKWVKTRVPTGKNSNRN